MASKELWRLSATEAVAGRCKGEFCPSDLVEAAVTRIEAVDTEINALPIRCFERAFDQARRIEATGQADEESILAGLPIAVKDYNDVGGVQTTYG